MSSDLPESLRWAREFLPDYFSDPPAAFHAELMHDLEARSTRLIARVAPRGHAKSTCASFAYPLWCICQQRRRNIVLLSHEGSLARQFLADIRNELESNERIRAAYGDLCRAAVTKPPKAAPKARPGRSTSRRAASAAKSAPRGAPPRPSRRWSASVFTTTTGVTVQAKGSGAGLRGTRVGPQRPDLIICDDIEKDQHVQTPEARRRLEGWLRRVVMPALAPDGELLLLGSILHYDSLLANLRDRARFPRWDYKVYRALEAAPCDDGTFDLVALWPARWPVARLLEERERIGTLAFEQEYQANPIDDSARVFRPEWLRRYVPAELDALPAKQRATLMAVDPATGAAAGDFCALWVGVLDTSSGVIYTVHLSLERIGIVEQVRRIVELWQKWRPAKIGIETVAYQVALRQILDEHSRREGLYMPVVPLAALGNKRARIEGTAPFFENGTMRLPAALDPEVETQFLHFPRAAHDDAPDVCAMGIELARRLRGQVVDGVIASAGRVTPRSQW